MSRKIALAAVVAALIALPFLALHGDVQIGNATGMDYNEQTGAGGWGSPVWFDGWHCSYFDC